MIVIMVSRLFTIEITVSRLTTKTESREFSRSESLESSVSKIETTSALLSPSESLEQAVKARQKTKRARKTCCIKASGKKDKKKKHLSIAFQYFRF